MVDCAEMVYEAGLEDKLQNMEREAVAFHWYRVREEAEVTHVLTSFIFS